MCMVRHGMLSERVGCMHARKLYVCASLVQNAMCTHCVSDWRENWRMWKPWRHQQGSASMKKFAGLSFQPRSLLCGCLSFSFSHCQRSRSYSYHHYALHCSPPRVHTSASVAWPYMAYQRGHMQRIRITWMGRTWSVGRCTCSCVGILGLTAITTTQCTVHHHTNTRALVWHGLYYKACQHGHVQCICITWMGQTQSVGWSVNWLVGQLVGRCMCSHRPR